jgi:curved DNA-binding protein CbpA
MADIETNGRDNKITDLYSVLEISRDATQSEIKENYLRLALIYHPDKGGDKAKFKEVAMAYKILSNEKKKKEYDSSLAATYNDLIGGRDTEYHKSDMYVKLDESGREIFDADAFNMAFNNSRSYKERNEFEELAKPLQKDINSDNSDVVNTFEDILKRRNLEDDILISKEESMSFIKSDGKIDNDLFTKLFNERRRKEIYALKEYDPDSCTTYNDNNYNNYLIGTDNIFGKEQNNMNNNNYIIDDIDDGSNIGKMTSEDITHNISEIMKDREYLYYLPEDQYIINPPSFGSELVIDDNITLDESTILE